MRDWRLDRGCGLWRSWEFPVLTVLVSVRSRFFCSLGTGLPSTNLNLPKTQLFQFFGINTATVLTVPRLSLLFTVLMFCIVSPLCILGHTSSRDPHSFLFGSPARYACLLIIVHYNKLTLDPLLVPLISVSGPGGRSCPYMDHIKFIKRLSAQSTGLHWTAL